MSLVDSDDLPGVSRMFDLGRLYEKALGTGDMGKAMRVFRSALNEVPDHMGDWLVWTAQMKAKAREDYSFIPLLSRNAYPYLVVFDDPDLLDQFDGLMSTYSVHFEPNDRAEFVAVVAQVRDEITTRRKVERFELRRLFRRDQWDHVAMTLYALISLGEVFKTIEDGKTYLHPEKPEAPETAAPIALAALAEPEAQVRVIDLSFVTVYGQEHAPHADYPKSRFESAEVTVKKTRTPMDSRRPRALTTLLVGDRTWLISEDKRSDGKLDASVEILDAAGEFVGSARLQDVRLPQNALATDALVSVDKALNLKVFDRDGQQRGGFALAGSAAVKAAFAPAAKAYPTPWVSSATASLELDLVTFAVLDHVFVHRLTTGECLDAFRLPGYFYTRSRYSDEDEEWAQNQEAKRLERLPDALDAVGLPRDATRRQIASAVDASGHVGRASFFGGSVRVVGRRRGGKTAYEDLDDIFNGLHLDQVEVVQASRDGTALWIAGRSGILLRYNLAGFVEEAWLLPNAAHLVVETEWGTWGISHNDVFYLKPGVEPELFDINDQGGTLISRDLMLSRVLHQGMLVDLRDRTVGYFDLKGTVRTRFLRGGKLTIETPTSSLEVG